MTREEAKDLLDNLIGMVDDNQDHDYDEALRMGIEALEQPKTIRCEECRHYRTVDIFGKRLTMCKRREYDSVYTEPDDFCSRAERRTNGET